MSQVDFPTGWLNSEQYHPEQHLSKARKSSAEPDYLNVAQRLVWFQREQRQMIAAGLAKGPFSIETKAIEIDVEKGYAIFKTVIRDVLGNVAEDVGTETRADFADFVEKAATKSKGRALLSLGYGTAFAPELDEGERIVDAPVERKPQQPAQNPLQVRADALKARAGKLGWNGTTYNKLVLEATQKTAQQLVKDGVFSPTAADLDKLERRIELLEKAPQEAAS